MDITIVGAGNVGTQLAVHAASKGNSVTIFTSKPKLISKELQIVDADKLLFKSAFINLATNNPEQAFPNADLILITMPSFCHKNLAKIIIPHVKKGVIIGFIPGTGGGECAFKSCIEKGAVLFGLQRPPSVSRLVEYGKSVCAIGYRSELFVCALPHVRSQECAKLMQSIYDIKCSTLKNYLSLTLTPSNPILHTTRLKNIFGDYKAGKVYDSVPLFYEDWDDETSVLLLACDDEVRNIYSCLDKFDLSDTKNLREHYESDNPEKLTKKIRSIQGFKGLKSPIVEVSGGYIPDFNSRYFSADFPFGLTIFIQVAKLLGIEVPNLEKTMDWYRQVVDCKEEFCFSDYGINSYDDLVNFYIQ